MISPDGQIIPQTTSMIARYHGQIGSVVSDSQGANKPNKVMTKTAETIENLYNTMGDMFFIG